MDGNRRLWLMLLLLSGCTMAGPGAPKFVAGPLQPNNCGTPYEFKPCRKSAAVAVRQVRPRPTVTIEEVDPARDRIMNTKSPDGLSNDQY